MHEIDLVEEEGIEWLARYYNTPREAQAAFRKAIRFMEATGGRL
jgi:hypothetical protein